MKRLILFLGWLVLAVGGCSGNGEPDEEGMFNSYGKRLPATHQATLPTTIEDGYFNDYSQNQLEYTREGERIAKHPPQRIRQSRPVPQEGWREPENMPSPNPDNSRGPYSSPPLTDHYVGYE